MLELELPKRITQIYDLRFKEYLLDKKNYDKFYLQYFNYFLKISKKWRRYFDAKDYNDILYAGIMTKIQAWNGKASLGTFLYSAIRFEFLEALRTENNQTSSMLFMTEDHFNTLNYDVNDSYEKINNLELTPEEKIVLDFLLRTNYHRYKYFNYSSQSFKMFQTKNGYNNTQLDFEETKKSLGLKIITEFLPDRKDLLLKFDLVKLRP